MKAAKSSDLKPSKFLVSVPLSDRTSGYLVYSTRSQRSFIFSEPFSSAVDYSKRLPSSVVDKLKEALFLVPEGLDETQEVLNENRKRTQESDILYHVIQPSAFCQMACGYCGQEHDKRSISNESIDDIITLIEKQLRVNKNYKKLSISWFGAEPLTSFKQVISMSERLINLSARHKLDYEAKIVTNGLSLTKEVAQALVRKAKVDFAEITLDGFSKSHDLARPLKNGRSSFNRIVSNIRAILDSSIGMKIRVRCNVSQENAESVFELAQYLYDEKLLQDLSIYLAPLHAWGNSAHEMGLDYADFAHLEISFFEFIGDLLGVSQPKLIPDRKYNTCLNTKPGSYVFDAHGNAYDCTEVSYVPTYYGSDHLLKDVSEGSNAARSFSEYHEGVSEGKYPCGDCRILPICGGSCPKLWTEGHIPCPSLKENIEQRLLMSFAQ